MKGWVLCGVCAVALTSAIVVACAVSSTADASGSRSWVVSGTLAGSYENDVGWVNCLESGASGSAHEKLSLRAKISPGRPATFGGGGMAVSVRLTPGGRWSAAGSYPPRREAGEDSITCAAQRNFNCGGPILRRGGPTAVILLSTKGDSVIGGFIQNPYFTETLGENPCSLSAGSGPGPLFGLQGSLIEPDALLENDARPERLSIPRARLQGRAPFTVTHSARPDGGCSREVYSRCTQRGSIKLTLRFEPA